MTAKKFYNGYLSYEAFELQLEDWYPKIVDLTSNISISGFSVDGGANRDIDMGSANDISLTSEFEQARQYKNINFLLAPTRPLAVYNLMEIAHKKITFKMRVQMIGHIGKAFAETLILEVDDAKFVGIPQKTEAANGKMVLRVKVQFSNAAFLVISPRAAAVAY